MGFLVLTTIGPFQVTRTWGMLCGEIDGRSMDEIKDNLNLVCFTFCFTPNDT